MKGRIFLIEIIVQNHRDALEAEKLGARRLEFVSAISEGGLTPSYGAMKKVFEKASVPVYTMIRPHSFSFVYDEVDFEIIEADVRQVLGLGNNRIVFGALNKDGTINEDMLKRIIHISPDLEITFHRAFDEVKDQVEAYETLSKYDQVKWILTSGGADTCLEGKESLRKLVELSRTTGGPQILPGSGLTAENLKEVHEFVQADQYHFGSAVRKDHSFAKGYDEETVKEILSIIR